MAADAAVVAVARARVAAGDSRVAGDRARVADIFRVAEDEASRAAGANISQDQAVAVPVASRVVVARTDFLTALGDSLEAKTSRDVEVFRAETVGLMAVSASPAVTVDEPSSAAVDLTTAADIIVVGGSTAADTMVATIRATDSAITAARTAIRTATMTLGATGFRAAG